MTDIEGHGKDEKERPKDEPETIAGSDKPVNPPPEAGHDEKVKKVKEKLEAHAEHHGHTAENPAVAQLKKDAIKYGKWGGAAIGGTYATGVTVAAGATAGGAIAGLNAVPGGWAFAGKSAAMLAKLLAPIGIPVEATFGTFYGIFVFPGKVVGWISDFLGAKGGDSHSKPKAKAKTGGDHKPAGGH